MGATTQPSFQQMFEQFLESCIELRQRKANDYTGSQDELSNYEAAAKVMGVSVDLAMLGRMMEKVERLRVLLGGTTRQVADETEQDTLRDIAIISGLIAVSLKRQTEQAAEQVRGSGFYHAPGCPQNHLPDMPCPYWLGGNP